MFVRAPPALVQTLAPPAAPHGRRGFDFLFLACIKASSSSRRCGNVESRVLCDFPHFHNEPEPPWVRFEFYPFYRVLLALPAQWAISAIQHRRSGPRWHRESGPFVRRL
jgi:hypothetical protein